MTTILSFKQAARRATRVALALVTGAALLCACTQEDAPDAPDGGDRIPVTFSAGIESAAVTRTTGLGNNTWTSTDRIGIIMAKAGTNIYTSGDTGILASNIEYAPGDIGTDKGQSIATFTPVSRKPIYYPRTGTVDFYAYYPHTPKKADGGELKDSYSFDINLSDQSNPATIDVLLAKVKGVAPGSAPVVLPFRHALSKFTLNVTAGEGITPSDISALKADDVEMTITPTGTFLIGDDDNIVVIPQTKTVHPYRETSASAGVDATFSVIVLFGIDEAIPVTFTIGGTVYTCTLSSSTRQPGANYVYPVTVRGTGITVGEPTIGEWTTNDRGTGTAEEIGKGIEKVFIPAGTFLMGSSNGSNIGNKDGSGLNTTPAETNRNQDEVQHKVTLTKGFYMAKYQTTNAQFAAFLNAIGVGSDGKCPAADSYSTAQHPGQLLVTDCTKGDAPSHRYQWGMKWNNNQWEPMSSYSDYPAIYVSWYGADEYAHWQGGLLPTEAQWEYACRAGSTTAYTGGDDDGLGDYGWYNSNSQNTTHPVGKKMPNAWGLYDMHGNVYEWCLDGYDGGYSADAVIDPVIPVTGLGKHIMRGGMYSNPAEKCRSAYRNSNVPGDSFYYHGFRIVFNE